MRLVNIDAAEFRGTTASKHRGTLAGALRSATAAAATAAAAAANSPGDVTVSANRPPGVIVHDENLVEIWESLFRDTGVSSQWRICDEPILILLTLNMAAVYNGLTNGTAPSASTQNNIVKMANLLGMNPAARTHNKVIKSDGTPTWGSDGPNRFADIENIA